MATTGYLDPPAFLLTAIALLHRFFMTAVLRLSIPSRALNAVALACVGFYPVEKDTPN